jgi:hypothetical protein
MANPRDSAYYRVIRQGLKDYGRSYVPEGYNDLYDAGFDYIHDKGSQHLRDWYNTPSGKRPNPYGDSLRGTKRYRLSYLRRGLPHILYKKRRRFRRRK